MHADQISCMNLSRTTQLTLILGGFLGEDVALKRHGAFDGATTAWLEPLGAPLLVFIFGMFYLFITLPQQVVEPFHALNLKSTCLHSFATGAVRS